MERYLIFAAFGFVSGLVFYLMALHHVKVRSEYDNGEKYKLLKNNKKSVLIWIFAAEFIFMIVCRLDLPLWDTIRVLIFAMLALNVSVVDILLRRIPNSILIGMLALQVADIGYMIVAEDAEPASVIWPAIGGLVIAYLIFMIPAVIGLSVGGGDVKYSAVIGFMLKFTDYTEAMFVMAVATLAYFIYLKITKTGNMKSKVPMAPFLSIGAIVAMATPIF